MDLAEHLADLGELCPRRDPQRELSFIGVERAVQHRDVASPHQLVTEFQRLTRPGAVIAMGTPNATAIDLKRASEFAHTIHAPYHRHILSRDALVKVGERAGWKLDRFYPTMYSNTRVPFGSSMWVATRSSPSMTQ